jgi:hypothetical protein
MVAKRHKTKFRVGDRVIVINVPGYIGTNGVVEQVKGFLNEKYVVKFPNGKVTKPIPSRFLTKDKRNN